MTALLHQKDEQKLQNINSRTATHGFLTHPHPLRFRLLSRVTRKLLLRFISLLDRVLRGLLTPLPRRVRLFLRDLAFLAMKLNDLGNRGRCQFLVVDVDDIFMVLIHTIIVS